MKTRRGFLKLSAAGTVGVWAVSGCSSSQNDPKSKGMKSDKPIVISTWDHGVQSNEVSWKILKNGGGALDAVEQGVKVVESDPNGHTVGLGGAPDREGKVTLDACIMDHKNRCGAVAFLQNIEHPISVARKVMEETPHVMLVGDGAYRFARQQGFEHTELFTEESREKWMQWLKTSNYKPEINVENHDTIASLALDGSGNLAGACTTSGMAYKLHGRVGDSPIIGAGLFVDNEVGAACGTGMGEAIIRIAGSSVIVEMMRNGKSPQEACEEAVRRIVEKHDDLTDLQVGFLALNINGEYGAYSVYDEFTYAVSTSDINSLLTSRFEIN